MKTYNGSAVINEYYTIDDCNIEIGDNVISGEKIKLSIINMPAWNILDTICKLLNQKIKLLIKPDTSDDIYVNTKIADFKSSHDGTIKSFILFEIV